MAPKVKKSVGRGGSKYSTVLLGSLFDEIAAIRIKSVKKNGKATGKWLEKMKKSLQRKLQSASKSCFVGESQTPEALKGEIEKVREKLKKQTKSVRDAALTSIKSTKLFEPSTTEVGAGPLAGRFESRTRSITDKIKNLAKQIEEAGGDLQVRLKSLTDLVSHSQTRLPKSSEAAPVKRGPGRPKKVTSPEPVLATMHRHLEKE
jgi:hypothetical protein